MFRYRTIVHASTKNSLLPFSRVMGAQIQPAITSFSAGEFRLQPVLSDNPGEN